MGGSGQRDGGGDKGGGEASLAEVYWSVARQLRQRHREALAPWEITPAQFRAVSTLLRRGPMRLSELSDALRIAPRSGTEVVDALEHRGLAERLPDPADRRATQVRLTEHGISTANAISADRDTETAGFFGKLSERDRAELTRILLALRS